MKLARFIASTMMILGSSYAVLGLFISLTDFGVGLAIAAAGMVIFELITTIQTTSQNKDWRRREEREMVWARRFEQGWWTE